MAAALLSVLKCFNGNMVAASRLLFGLGRRGFVHPQMAHVHPENRTPSVAIVCLGIATVLITLGGDSILVPVAEVGSVAAAVGWMAACASFARMKPSLAGRLAAFAGLLVTAALVLMKVIPFVPGHFTIYEWIAVAAWCAIGWLLHRGNVLTSA